MDAFTHFLNGTVDILLSYGLPGVVMGSSWIATYKLYKRNCALQDARLADASAQITALNASTNAMSRMADALYQNSKHNT